MYDTEQTLVEIKDPNAKCKKIVFYTTDLTLVGAAMMKLGFKPDQCNLIKGTASWKAQKPLPVPG